MIEKRIEAPFPSDLVVEIVQLTERAFDNAGSENSIAAYQWRLENMPNVSVFVTEVESRMVGFKIGYAESYDRYYSWLGGVDPDFQKQGIGRRLMEEQHGWLAGSRFKMVRTYVAEKNEAMIALNTSCGMEISGKFLKRSEPFLIMERCFHQTA